MNPSGQGVPDVERQETDESLRAERKKTDGELARRREVLVEDADGVVREARSKADEVLLAARKRADGTLKAKSASPVVVAELDRERSNEDKVLRKERSVADQQLEKEREEREAILKQLLRGERATTDGHLSIERMRADKAVFSRDDFMGMVSHDLRTLLGGIALDANLISKQVTETKGDPSIASKAEGIQRYVVRMARLISDLVDMASIEAGKPMVSAQAGDAAPLLEESHQAFEKSAGAKQLALSIEIGPGSMRAVLDHDRILQVLGNLVGNAIKFTPSGGSIRLSAERLDGTVRFAVVDTGPGIDESEQDAVFNRFWQSSENDRRGMGLGLYISKCIVEAHGGTIGLKSKVGEGSRFFFTVPAA